MVAFQAPCAEFTGQVEPHAWHDVSAASVSCWGVIDPLPGGVMACTLCHALLIPRSSDRHIAVIRSLLDRGYEPAILGCYALVSIQVAEPDA